MRLPTVVSSPAQTSRPAGGFSPSRPPLAPLTQSPQSRATRRSPSSRTASQTRSRRCRQGRCMGDARTACEKAPHVLAVDWQDLNSKQKQESAVTHALPTACLAKSSCKTGMRFACVRCSLYASTRFLRSTLVQLY